MRSNVLWLVVIGLLLYIPSIFGPFLWDDEDFVYANTYVRDFRVDKFFTESQTAGRGKPSNYFRPVPQIFYATTHLLFGFNPLAFHLVNVLVHIGAALSIYYFFKLFLKSHSSLAPPFNIPFLIAVVFLIHPVQTEAVSYISGLSDPLFVFFGMLSLCCFQLRHQRTNMVALSVLFFTLSLLSKETALVFLPLTLLIDYKRAWGHILVTLLYLAHHFLALNPLTIQAQWGQGPYAQSLLVRLLTFIQNLFIYLQILIFPKDLFMERDYSITIQQSVVNIYLFIFLLVNLALGWWFKKQNKSISLTHLPPLVYCYLAFFICFIPYSGVLLINGIFYEHFLYLPMVFFFAFFLILGEKLLTNRYLKIVLVVIFVALVLRNIARQYEWNDSIRFYQQTLQYAPGSARILNGLGMAYAERGNNQQAMDIYHKGIKQHPEVPNFYHNLANLYAQEGKFDLAERNYLEAIKVNSSFFFSWYLLADLYKKTGQEEKLQELEKKFEGISQ